MIDKKKLLKTKTLQEAIQVLFDKGIDTRDRNFLLRGQAMTGIEAQEYDLLARNSRSGTYKRIARDFIERTGYNTDKPSTILDVGCGPGLLSLELASQTNAKVIGIDCSTSMIRYARKNRDEQLPYQDPNQFQTMAKSRFLEMDITDLTEFTTLAPIDYVICRNVLHRVNDYHAYPLSRALAHMWTVIPPGGQIYIRDLRRDADWGIIKERIGKQRWKSFSLVRDYVLAMAGMLTIRELTVAVRALGKAYGIKHYTITNGAYLGPRIESRGNLNEYEKETEYVCVIKK